MSKKSIKIKKQYIVGKQDYINATTGEIVSCTVIEKEINNDFNFHKIWINDLLAILNLIGGKKLKVFEYLMSQMRTQDNTIIATYDMIKRDTRVSYQTIRDTIKILLDTNFMRKITNGVYMVNPDVIVKGNSGKRSGLLIKYAKIEEKERETKCDLDLSKYQKPIY